MEASKIPPTLPRDDQASRVKALPSQLQGVGGPPLCPRAPPHPLSTQRGPAILPVSHPAGFPKSLEGPMSPGSQPRRGTRQGAAAGAVRGLRTSGRRWIAGINLTR